MVAFPARPFPYMERRVVGSIHRSSYPPCDVPLILDLHRQGLPPLDRLTSHRLPLERTGEAFDLMGDGWSRRVLLDVSA